MALPVTNGAPLPSEPARCWYKIVSPTGDMPLVVTLLGETFLGVWTHFQSCVVPCDETPECVRCKTGLGRRWTGYIASYSHNDRRERVLALTEGAARQLLPFLTRYGSLRGLSFQLTRKIKSKPNSPVILAFRGKAGENELRPDFDIYPSLLRLWGINEDFLARGRTRVRDARLPDAGAGPRPEDTLPS